MDTNRPDVTISVVNTNNRRLLEPCLESIYKTWTGRYTMELIVVDNASTDGSAEMVGPKTFNPDGSLQDTCVRFPTVTLQLKHILFQRFSDYCVISYPPSVHDTEADVEWLRGSAMLVRREAMDEVGMLDERFF